MRREQMKLHGPVIILLVLLFCVPCLADEFVVLDGLSGIRGKWLKDEVSRLRCDGHCVHYRPWWRWRRAARDTTGPVTVIGYSLGGSRAVMAADRMQIKHLELVDPYKQFGVIYLPCGVPTTVYRATKRSWINGSPVCGTHLEIPFPADHSEMPECFRRY